MKELAATEHRARVNGNGNELICLGKYFRIFFLKIFCSTYDTNLLPQSNLIGRNQHQKTATLLLKWIEYAIVYHANFKHILQNEEKTEQVKTENRFNQV